MKPITWLVPFCLGTFGAAEVHAQFAVNKAVAVTPFVIARPSSFVRLSPHPAFTVHHRWDFPTYWYPHSYWGYPYLGSSVYFLDPIVVTNGLPPIEIAPRRAEEEIAKGKLIIKRGKGEAVGRIFSAIAAGRPGSRSGASATRRAQGPESPAAS